MIEYLYNAIRVSAGVDETIISAITDNGASVSTGCGLMLHIDDESIIYIEGECENGVWKFNIPGSLTEGLKGRYWYCFMKDGSTLCFKQPIYFM